MSSAPESNSLPSNTYFIARFVIRRDGRKVVLLLSSKKNTFFLINQKFGSRKCNMAWMSECGERCLSSGLMSFFVGK